MSHRWTGLLVSLVCAAGLPGLCHGAETYGWQRSYAKVDPKGDLSWAPEPFAFEKGDSVRYIDFAAGDDGADGSQAHPWKHHPWDPQAAGQAKAASGVDTYVFKCGVVYRGNLVAAESGKAGHPIRLTSDPSWGRGEAVIAGSELVTGWKKGADLKEMPEPEKVWVADLTYAPRRVWMVDKDGAVTRIALARTPNWKVSDPEDVMSEWWQWENPQWWVAANRTTTVDGKEMELGIDAKHLTQDPSYYKDAIVWSEWAIVMGTPFPAQIVQYDPQRKAIAFEGRWFGVGSVQIHAGSRYFLEDKPQYLDEPGEFWFAKKGEGGRLYIRLPGDVDPNTVQIEAAKRYNLIEDQASARSPLRLDIIGPEERAKVDTTGLSHFVISGLSFRFNDAWWDYWFAPWMHKDVDNACIRLLGSSDDVVVANCKFEYVSKAVRINPINDRTRDGSVVVCDNDIEYTDDAAMDILKGPGGLEDVRVLRNNLYMIGLRPFRQSDAHALRVLAPVTAEIAGNILKRTYGAGIYVDGFSSGSPPGEAALARYLIHHNKVEQPLLAANDWGGFYNGTGGPFYYYDNICADPNGYWNWAYQNSPNSYSGRDGFAIYHDHAKKCYDFNNILWGLNNDRDSKLCNKAAWNEAAPNVHNNYFNNTIYRFAEGSNWSSANGWHSLLGNVWDDISQTVFNHGRPKGNNAPAPPGGYPYQYLAYGNNVFYQVSNETFGSFEFDPGAQPFKDFQSFQQALVKDKALDAGLGVTTDKQPLRDPANRDMRPAAGSAAIDQGVKFFVPWVLYAPVAEWNFYHVGNDVAQIPDEHWCSLDYAAGPDGTDIPTYPLTAVGATEDSYVQGDLEDWIHGALRLNGKDQYCVLTQATIARPVTVSDKKGEHTVPPEQVKTVDVRDSSFILQIYFKTEPAARKAVLIKKMDDQAGYALTVDGAVTFAVKAAGKDVSVTGKAAVNDGKWHHVLAEADRKAGKMTVYVDGQVDAEGAGPGDASLSNGADFTIGGTPTGDCLAGTVDFAMVSLGSLADAKTTIGELYAWQFNGPFLTDFAGRAPNGVRRDAGALEYQKGD